MLGRKHGIAAALFIMSLAPVFAMPAFAMAANTAPAPVAPARPATGKPVVQAPPGPVPVFRGIEYVQSAKYGLEDARRIAQKAHAGAVTDSALAPNKAGTLRYVFKIGGATVLVNAQTGAVMATEK